MSPLLHILTVLGGFPFIRFDKDNLKCMIGLKKSSSIDVSDRNDGHNVTQTHRETRPPVLFARGDAATLWSILVGTSLTTLGVCTIANVPK